VAKQFTNADAIVMTELMFSGKIKQLEIEEALALFSILITQIRPPRFSKMCELEISKQFWDTSIYVETVINELVRAEQEEGVENSQGADERINYYFYEMIYEWAKQKSFFEVSGMSDIDDGLVVRMVTSVAHTAEQVKRAAEVMGDTVLVQKMTDAMALVKRDIIFTPSLYLQ